MHSVIFSAFQPEVKAQNGSATLCVILTLSDENATGQKTYIHTSSDCNNQIGKRTAPGNCAYCELSFVYLDMNNAKVQPSHSFRRPSLHPNKFGIS
jgi:hypothetical protein